MNPGCIIVRDKAIENDHQFFFCFGEFRERIRGVLNALLLEHRDNENAQRVCIVSHSIVTRSNALF